MTFLASGEFPTCLAQAASLREWLTDVCESQILSFLEYLFAYRKFFIIITTMIQKHHVTSYMLSYTIG